MPSGKGSDAAGQTPNDDRCFPPGSRPQCMNSQQFSLPTTASPSAARSYAALSYTLPQHLAGPEIGTYPQGNVNLLPGPGVAPLHRVAGPHRERAETAHFHAPAAGQMIADLAQNGFRRQIAIVVAQTALPGVQAFDQHGKVQHASLINKKLIAPAYKKPVSSLLRGNRPNHPTLALPRANRAGRRRFAIAAARLTCFLSQFDIKQQIGKYQQI